MLLFDYERDSTEFNYLPQDYLSRTGEVPTARLRTLGADTVIDDQSANFARQVKDVDLVLNLVGPAAIEQCKPGHAPTKSAIAFAAA